MYGLVYITKLNFTNCLCKSVTIFLKSHLNLQIRMILYSEDNSLLRILSLKY